MLYKWGECHVLLPGHIQTWAQDLQMILQRWIWALLQQLIVSMILFASLMFHPHTIRFETTAKQTSYTHSASCCWGGHQVCQQIMYKNTFVVWKYKCHFYSHLSHLKSFTLTVSMDRDVFSKSFVNWSYWVLDRFRGVPSRSLGWLPFGMDLGSASQVTQSLFVSCKAF